jgi:fermentation-respiration switch protein FrsA (DUF1100 family)
MNFVVFNYRGYGASTGSPDPSRLQLDGISVAKYLQDELGIVNLVVHGESVGGMVACGIARQVELQGSVSRSSMTFPHLSLSLVCVSRQALSLTALSLVWMPSLAGCSAIGQALDFNSLVNGRQIL